MLPEGDAHRPATLAADGFTDCSSGGHCAGCVPDAFDGTNDTVISGEAAQFCTELVDGPSTMAHRLHTCSRGGWAFASGSHRPRRFRHGLSSLIRRMGMPEWTLRRLLGALRPLNMTRESSEFSRPHDSLRIHFAELNFGIVFPRSKSCAEAVSEGNPSSDAHCRSLSRRGLKRLRRGIFTGAPHSPCGLVTVASSASSAMPWNFVGLWHVAVVHRFDCRSDVSRGCERVSLPRRLRERLWPRVSTWRANSLSLPCSSCASFSFAASPLRRFFTQDLSMLFDVRSGRCFCRRGLRGGQGGSLRGRSSLTHVLSIGGGGGPANSSLRRMFA